MDFHLSDAVRDRIQEMLPEAIELRHRLHGQPETKFEEYGTMALIRDTLSGGSMEILDPIVGTDTVGLLKGKKPGPTVLLRTEIDALPIDDASGKPWASKIPGKSHACGHDGHMAMLLTAAKVLEQSKDELAGNLRFVFQPAEEEIGGGKALVRAGLLELEPRPDVAFALHGWSGLRLGAVSSAPGPAMSAADSFVVRISGKGGHGGMPNKAVDPILAAVHAIEALQTIASRLVDPLEPVVVSVCSISGGHSRNVIPAEVAFEGTVRYFNKGLQGFIRDKMDQILKGTCVAAGCTYSFEFIEGYIPLINDPRAVSAARAIATEVLGADAWSDDHRPSMGTEDFAYYLDAVPGCYLRLGIGDQWPSLHSANFDFNDLALESGITFLVGLALGYSKTVLDRSIEL